MELIFILHELVNPKSFAKDRGLHEVLKNKEGIEALDDSWLVPCAAESSQVFLGTT